MIATISRTYPFIINPPPCPGAAVESQVDFDLEDNADVVVKVDEITASIDYILHPGAFGYSRTTTTSGKEHFAMESRTVPPPSVLRAITVIERTGSVFSLIGCLFIIFTFLGSSAFRKPINRLMFYASFGNMLVNVGTLIARAYVDRQNSVGCQLQAFLIQE